jgi:hypothetical protein
MWILIDNFNVTISKYDKEKTFLNVQYKQLNDNKWKYNQNNN